MPIRVRARTIDILSGERIFRGGIETRASAGGTQFVFALQQRKCTGTSIATGRRLTVPNVCLPTLDFHLRRQKFSIIWPGSRMHRTRSTASFIGGCSTPAFGTGRRKLRRPSRNSSNEVSSKKSHLRTAKYFTTSLRVISPLFSNGHHETLLLTQLRKPSNKKGQSCLPR